MNTDTLIGFLGDATFTFMWLDFNRYYFKTMARAILRRNENEDGNPEDL